MQFKEEQDWIKKNKDYLEKLREQDEAAAQAAMPNNIWEALDQMTGAQPKPPGESGSEVQPAPATSSTTTTPSTSAK
jgi:import inner membrane translocase subunit TIM50